MTANTEALLGEVLTLKTKISFLSVIVLLLCLYELITLQIFAFLCYKLVFLTHFAFGAFRA